MSRDVKVISPVGAPDWLTPVRRDIEAGLRTKEDEIPPGEAGQVLGGGKEWITLSAENLSFSPAGSIAATDVQAAITELDTEKVANSGAAVLALLITVDGSGSGLDADKVRGTTPTSTGLAVLEATNAAAARGAIGAQASDTKLTNLAALTPGIDQMIYWVTNVPATTSLTPFARSMLACSNASEVKSLLGIS